MKLWRALLAGFGVAVVAWGAWAAEDAVRAAPKVGADGLFAEDFYRTSTFDMAKDLALAIGEGKPLAIFWEREYCEYCAQLHNEALVLPELHRYVADRFYVVRFDFHGKRMVTDFDGTRVTEEQMRTRHRVLGTPTLSFRIEGFKEVLRIPGYVEPDVLGAAFEFVDAGVYVKMGIGAYLREVGLF